ncbi:chaplin [Streptomyces sp. AF1A]|uniref:chaplin n=1 Tax=Streptomyces sp. AF1A TaxID=3394350 RepID=UPI0039BCEE19
MIAIAVASGAMAVAGAAHADSAADASASGSPGLVSGNAIQVPVHVPVNLCGNTVDVVGLLNPSMGNRCANHGDEAGDTGTSTTPRGAAAHSSTHDSPGLISGNSIHLPVHVPVNAVGNSVNVVGIGNPAVGNTGDNGSDDHTTRSAPTAPVHHQTPVKAPVQERSTSVVRQQATGTLAHTGADSLWVPALASLVSLTAGAVLYRRFRPSRMGH